MTRRNFKFMCVAILISVISAPCHAISVGDGLKISYIYKFLNFIVWPEETFSSDDQPFKMCLAMDDEYFNAAHKLLTDKKNKNRSIRVEQISGNSKLESCQLIFISSSKPKIKKSLKALNRGASVLTISDLQNFISDGGMIGFVLKDNKLRFKVNLSLIQSKKIKVDSRLLTLALEVF